MLYLMASLDLFSLFTCLISVCLRNAQGGIAKHFKMRQRRMESLRDIGMHPPDS